MALAALLAPVWRRGEAPSTGRVVGGGVLAAGLVISTAAIGHPVAGPWPWLATTVTVVHVAGMTVWLGGLAGLMAAVLRPQVPPAEVAAVVPRYSRLAFASVAALVVSGTVQAVREVESPTALFVTAYGWVLVAKLVLVAVVLAAAGVSRVWVQQRLGVRRSRPGGRRGLTAHAFAATDEPSPEVEAAAEAAGAGAVGERGRPRPRAAPLGARRARRRGRDPRAVGGPGRSAAGPRRRSPSRSTRCCRCRASAGRPAASRCPSTPPGRAATRCTSTSSTTPDS